MDKQSLIRILDETKFALTQEDFDRHQRAYKELFERYHDNLSIDDLVELAHILDDNADVDIMEGIIKFIQYYGAQMVSEVLAKSSQFLLERAPMYGSHLFSSVVLTGDEGRNALREVMNTASQESRAALKSFLQELILNPNVLNQVSPEEAIAIRRLADEILPA